MNSLQLFYRLILLIAVATTCGLGYGIYVNTPDVWQPAAVISTIAWTIMLGASENFKLYRFTAWVIVVFVAGMIYPQVFQQKYPVDFLNNKLVLFMIQLVMFGMGTQMSIKDFTGIMKSPYAIFIGLSCQFLIMPLSGWGITKVIHFDPEIAAGVILIGCCSSGLASNLMTYIAKANVALSITITAFATMLAPLVTPLWMKVLAGQLVAIDVQKMMIEIIQMVIIPIVAALVDDFMKSYGKKAILISWLGALLGAGWLMIQDAVKIHIHPIAFDILSNLACAILIGLVYHYLVKYIPQISRIMPTLSMIGILFVILVTTVKGRDNLLHIGPLLFLAVVIHNSLGYLLGYWGSRLVGMDQISARTIAIEVGLQNGGMAAGLAGNMGKMATVGLAAAIFATWMNVSGSILAVYWSKKPAK